MVIFLSFTLFPQFPDFFDFSSTEIITWVVHVDSVDSFGTLKIITCLLTSLSNCTLLNSLSLSYFAFGEAILTWISILYHQVSFLIFILVGDDCSTFASILQELKTSFDLAMHLSDINRKWVIKKLKVFQFMLNLLAMPSKFFGSRSKVVQVIAIG